MQRIADRNIWVIYATTLLLGSAYGVSIAVLAVHLEAYGIPKIAMGGLAAAFAAGIVVFSIPAGWFIQKLGPKPTMLGALVGYACCVGAFPFLTTPTGIGIARFFDGACSVGIWVSAETALLARSDKTNKAFVMSLYAMSLAIGYVLGPILAAALVPHGGTRVTFFAAAVLGLAAAAVVLVKLDPARPRGLEGERTENGSPLSEILWRTKTSCLATFAYGYFQAAVVLFLPLYLIQAKGVPKERTILITAFFAGGMLIASPWVSKVGDAYGHLLVMRVLGAVGAAMVASFVLLDSFALMCAAVFLAGATLASISPVSLALQGVVTPAADLGRANAFYNAFYAAGMLVGPPISSVLFVHFGGPTMLIHLAGLWAVFVVMAWIYAGDDPRARRLAAV